ncbi:hypothetical protein [Salinicoccus kekensis]|uniref:Uncharacterized protein n=1 Tax=Salinicoccus kekensis TaxID=714307 RepID=A0A285UV12_9STAP|nr:hypothetical protein [Salinicoccus kekensis]SOC45218.1 hypothetical protein SAMN05878391_2658 [Salinicoccus kekensis]
MNIQEDGAKSRKDSETNDTQSEVIELKSFSLDSSEGLMCDFNTGICGPVDEEEKKEDEK